MDVHRGHQQIFTRFFHTCLGLNHVYSQIACLHLMFTINFYCYDCALKKWNLNGIWNYSWKHEAENISEWSYDSVTFAGDVLQNLALLTAPMYY